MSDRREATVVPVDDKNVPRDLRREVRTLLEQGQVVGLPTETVYGLAARADDPAALDRLHEVKGRDPDLALTWAVSERSSLEGLGTLPALAQRLAERYWPGPLTLVVDGVAEGLESIAKDGWTGLRLPAHGATRRILDDLPFPVVLTSANPSGSPALTDAPSVGTAFSEQVPLVVDGGPARLGEASAVLRLGQGRFELLRKGLLELEDLRRTAGLRLAFCCTGNTCRSPMAEGLARALLSERLGTEDLATFGFEVSSMGVFAAPGAPASREAVDVLRRRGLDLSQHASRPALADEVAALDRVYCLTSSHREALRSMLPPSAGKHVELLDPAGGDIADPIGGPEAVYEACANQISAALEARAATWV